jgi:hypothetical protein
MTDFAQLDEELKEIDNIIKTNGDINEAKELIKQCRITISGISDRTKKQAYKTQLTKLDDKIPRQELLSGKKDDKKTDPVDQQEILADSLRVLKETEKTAQKITGALQQQGEQIKHVKDETKKLGQQIGQAEKTTRKIEKQNHPFWWLFGRST